MTKKKDVAGKESERQARGKPGPPRATKNEKEQRSARKGGGGGNASRGVPKLGKHDSSRGDSSGDGLH
jgi:hypothetical protein